MVRASALAVAASSRKFPATLQPLETADYSLLCQPRHAPVQSVPECAGACHACLSMSQPQQRHRPHRAGKAEGTKYTSEQLPEGVVTKGGSSWTKDWLKFDNSYFTEVCVAAKPPPGSSLQPRYVIAQTSTLPSPVCSCSIAVQMELSPLQSQAWQHSVCCNHRDLYQVLCHHPDAPISCSLRAPEPEHSMATLVRRCGSARTSTCWRWTRTRSCSRTRGSSACCGFSHEIKKYLVFECRPWPLQHRRCFPWAIAAAVPCTNTCMQHCEWSRDAY